jgi:hypothetical protein
MVVALLCACTTRPVGQNGKPSTSDAAVAVPKDVAYVCPMDRDVRSSAPGKCPRCGMALVAGTPDPIEYHIDLAVNPNPPQPNEPTELRFQVFDPWANHLVQKFLPVHEKLFHAFIVSRDLESFVHDHPTLEGGVFRYTARFPKPGMYRILTDFYPEGATPQLLTKTVFVAGAEAPAAALGRDDSPKTAENLTVGLTVSPHDPVAGGTTQLRFVITPADGIERLLGAWGHMLAVSDDVIDMIHTHPAMADGSAEMQFSLVFPRPHPYRVWVQFQRKGVVNTVHFDIPIHPSPANQSSH